MATTNYLLFNPSELNTESDANYIVDPTRLGGAQSGGILPSTLFNKVIFQQSEFTTAFATMMVNKGFTVNDAPFSSLVAVLANVITSADLSASMISVAYASSMTFNVAGAAGFEVVLTGNVASSSLSNTKTGPLLFVLVQDGTGGRTFSWPSSTTPGGPICPFPNGTSVQAFFQIPTGAIIATSPMLWITATGVVIQPTPTIVGISTSGTVATPYNRIVEVVNCSGGNVTRNLFSAVGTSGLIYSCKRAPGDTSTNSLIVQPSVGGQTIDGFPNFGPIPPYNSFDFMSNGVDAFILV